MKKFYKYILGLLVFFPSLIFGQSADSIFNHSVGNFNLEHARILKESGLVSDYRLSLLGMYLIELTKTGQDIDTSLTYKQLFDSLDVFIARINSKTYNENSFGKDSVFLRTPSGEKFFLGMGEMSFKELVLREAINFPETYQKESLNQVFDDPILIAELIKNENLSEFQSGILGNVLIVLSENDLNLEEYRLGDFLEISRRVISSKEFKPFLKNFKQK